MIRVPRVLRRRNYVRLRWTSVLTLAAVTMTSGCAPSYVLRLACEEARILWRRQPIESLLAGNLDAETRSQLELVLAVRQFAAGELALSVGGSYSSVSRVDDRQVVHVVTAAPRHSLSPHTWWFPIVGNVPYRGYFDRTAAEKLVEAMERDGYDTYLRPSIAFSTLGWFDDPLLSNLLRLEPARLVEVVLHELLHNTTYLHGQAAFNESFASFVGSRGAEAFFAHRGDLKSAQRAAELWEDSLQFARLLHECITRLERAYARGIGPDERTALLRSLRDDFERHDWRAGHSPLGDKTLNNAVLVHYRLYNDRLDLFERAFEQNGEDLRRTVAWIRTLVENQPDAYARLEMVLAPPADIAGQ